MLFLGISPDFAGPQNPHHAEIQFLIGNKSWTIEDSNQGLESQLNLRSTLWIDARFSDSLRSISQRYQVPLNLIERFNPRATQARNRVYLPAQDGSLHFMTNDRASFKIVKLMRDPFLRPIKLGDWSALEEQNYPEAEVYSSPDSALTGLLNQVDLVISGLPFTNIPWELT